MGAHLDLRGRTQFSFIVVYAVGYVTNDPAIFIGIRSSVITGIPHRTGHNNSLLSNFILRGKTIGNTLAGFGNNNQIRNSARRIMAIYAIGDLHLSVAADKPMDIFAGWENHTEKLIANWKKKITDQDTIVLAGDISWEMSLGKAIPDFRLIHQLPGQKIILKGNHDYWWTSLSKMRETLEKHELDSIHFLHNNSYYVEGVHICGSRGWIFENGEPYDEKIIRREALRIEASLKSRGSEEGETMLFLHYPPIYAGQTLEPYIKLMQQYGVSRCYYGHIHGKGYKYAVSGLCRGIEMSLISADYLSFDPLLIKK